RDVNKGDLFIFHKGENFDPHSDYQAIENKAHAFINEKHLNTDLPQFITEDTSHLIGLIAARFYGYPTESMTNIAVTGTNGKTRSEEHTSELQSRFDLVCRLLLEKKKSTNVRVSKTMNKTSP